MVRLLLVRHGETDWNSEGRYQGNTDVPLSVAGLRQAEAAARRLAGERPCAVYSSDLARARETAAAVAAACRIEVRLEPGLREMRFGAWEGLTHVEIAERYPREWAAWIADPRRVAPPGGETADELAERVAAAMRRIRCECAGATAVVVAHGGSLQTLLCLALGVDPAKRWQFRLRHAAVTEVHLYDEGAILATLNDCRHLDGLSEVV